MVISCPFTGPVWLQRAQGLILAPRTVADLHRERLRGVRATVDNKPPPKVSHLSSKSKRQVAERGATW